MPRAKRKNRPWKTRRQYVIDGPLQMGVAAHFLTGLGAVALLCAAVVYVFLSGSAVPAIDPLRRFLLVANATYFILAAGILSLLTILLTHRFAGPAYVMQVAIKGMLKGDFTRRLTLRKRDYLKPLAADLAELRGLWMRQDESNRAAFDSLERAVEDGDTGEAMRLLTQLREGLVVQTDTEDETQPAPTKERESVLAS